MHNPPVVLLRIKHAEFFASYTQHTRIAHLPAALGIKRRPVEDDLEALFAVSDGNTTHGTNRRAVYLGAFIAFEGRVLAWCDL